MPTVVMRNTVRLPTGEVHVHEAVDHPSLEQLDAYVADARTRWASVEVTHDSDAGPGGQDDTTTKDAT